MTLGERSEASGRRLSRWFRRKLREPSTALIAVAIFLPMSLFGLAAWRSHEETLREAEARVERTARVLEEHALKVFETHRLVIQQINTRLRFIDWSREEDRRDLHLMLKQLQDDLDQVSTLTVVDAQGRMRASGRRYPADPAITFTDRDYFQHLRLHESALPYVSKSYPGRTSGILIFNLAARTVPAKDGAFDGVIAVSVDRNYFERFYEAVEKIFDHTVDLVRDDGEVLARTPGSSSATTLPAASLLRGKMKTSTMGTYTGVSRFDQVERIYGYRKVGGYPVFVRFGISVHSALAPWRKSLLAYGIVAALASLALVAVSLLALRQTGRERHARRRWEETAEALRAEAAHRSKVEDQLRQSQKMEAVGRLTGGIAHDFNNLLTAVIGSLEMVRRRGANFDPKMLGLVANALEGAQRAASLTSRLLAFSRQQPLQPERVDANKLVAGMSDLLKRSLGETIEIETVLGAALWPILCDPNQLESAILNLAVNGRDAMPDGGHLRIETANALAAPRSLVAGGEFAAGDFVMIAVTDDGIGIDAETLANVFEPFFTTKPVGKGTGLGLSQVYGFVRQSGGQVGVDSTVGAGTTFKLYLPRDLREGSVSSEPKSTMKDAPIHGRGQTILIVEDEPIVRELGIEALEEAGYTVVSAANGPAALEMFCKTPDIALLFTDIVLGSGMNGREVAEEIRRAQPDLPVLFTSGYAGDVIFHGGRIDEGLVLLSKPFTSTALVNRVGEMLARAHHSPRQLAAL